jgi:hypothetical protein
MVYHKRAHNEGLVDAGPPSPGPLVSSSSEEECGLSHLASLPSFGPLPFEQAPLQRTHGSRLASQGVLVYETRDPVLLVSGKVRHAQGQRLNRFEVKEREKVREQKGRGKCPPSFLCF